MLLKPTSSSKLNFVFAWLFATRRRQFSRKTRSSTASDALLCRLLVLKDCRQLRQGFNDGIKASLQLHKNCLHDFALLSLLPYISAQIFCQCVEPCLTRLPVRPAGDLRQRPLVTWLRHRHELAPGEAAALHWWRLPSHPDLGHAGGEEDTGKLQMLLCLQLVWMSRFLPMRHVSLLVLPSKKILH